MGSSGKRYFNYTTFFLQSFFFAHFFFVCVVWLIFQKDRIFNRKATQPKRSHIAHKQRSTNQVQKWNIVTVIQNKKWNKFVSSTNLNLPPSFEYHKSEFYSSFVWISNQSATFLHRHNQMPFKLYWRWSAQTNAGYCSKLLLLSLNEWYRNTPEWYEQKIIT